MHGFAWDEKVRNPLFNSDPRTPIAAQSYTSIGLGYKEQGIPSSSKAGTRLDRQLAPVAETRKARV